MHLNHKIAQALLKVKPGKIIYTSLRYRDDKTRRALGLLSHLGYFKKIDQFTYKRLEPPTKK